MNNELSSKELSEKYNISEDIIKTIQKELKEKPKRKYKSIELFAGAGGLALGLERAGFHSVLLNEKDSNACKTLRKNKPNWNVVQEDITKIDFKMYRDKIDFLSGGFPCQAFSYSGKQLGFEDTRGTLFFEFARAIKETNVPVFLGENVKGLLTHDNGRTIETIINTFHNLGYVLIIPPKILNASHYNVPQKRERLFLIGIRSDLLPLLKEFDYFAPFPKKRILTMSDALFSGELFETDVPLSDGQKYPDKKKKVLDLVPQGGYWKSLPIDIQRAYMKGSFLSGGGKTGMARRLSLSEPSLTLTCSPSQNQTERCHPTETRPLRIREYARIQTFPDEWLFEGSISSQYRQIGNAVPVNLAYEVGKTIIRLLNKLEEYIK